MTVKSKKRRLKRAHAHQAHCKGREQFHNAFAKASLREKEDAALAGTVWKNGVVIKSMRTPDLVIVDDLKDFQPTHAHTEFGTIELTPPSRPERRPDPKLISTLETPPSRAKCPSCGFSQKVRKNGTMSRHDVYVGSDPRECEGSGRNWNG